MFLHVSMLLLVACNSDDKITNTHSINCDGDWDCDGISYDNDCDDFDPTIQDCPVCGVDLNNWISYQGFSEDTYAWRWGYDIDGIQHTRFFQIYIESLGTIRLDHIYDQDGKLTQKTLDYYRLDGSQRYMYMDCIVEDGACLNESTLGKVVFSFTIDGFEIHRNVNSKEDNYLFDSQSTLIEKSYFGRDSSDGWENYTTSLDRSIYRYAYADFGKQIMISEEIYSRFDTSSDTTTENSIKEYYMNGVLKREYTEHNGSNDAIWWQNWNNETLYTINGGFLKEESYAYIFSTSEETEEWMLKEYSEGVLINYQYSFSEPSYYDILVIDQTFDQNGNETYLRMFADTSQSFYDETTEIIHEYNDDGTLSFTS